MSGSELRANILNDRHRALGSPLDSSWNDMALPQDYSTSPYEQTAAVRYRAGLFDVSMLKIVDVAGPDARAVLDYLITSNVAAMKPGDSLISGIVNEAGGLIDDVLVYCDAADTFRLSHGTGITEEALAEAAKGKNMTWARNDAVNVLAYQGPLALELLAPHTPMDLAGLPYFRHQKTTLFGKSVILARGGYSGERGYEVFCAAADAPFIWDTILEQGKPHGVLPVSWACLDIVRVEASLLFFPFDMPHVDTTPWEVKMDWAVDMSKPDFRGKKALAEKRGKERSFVAGIEIQSDSVVTPGAKITKGGKVVGTVNSTTWSEHLMKSLALVDLPQSLLAFGTALEIVDGSKTMTAEVVRTPFYDPLRLRTHPLSER